MSTAIRELAEFVPLGSVSVREGARNVSATRSDEPIEAPAKTNSANYFELQYAWPE